MQREIKNPFDVNIEDLSFDEIDELCVALNILTNTIAEMEGCQSDNIAARELLINLHTCVDGLYAKIAQRIAAIDLTTEQKEAIEQSIETLNTAMLYADVDADMSFYTGSVH